MDSLNSSFSSLPESVILPPYRESPTENSIVIYRLPPSYIESEGATQFMLREINLRATSQRVRQELSQKQFRYIALTATIASAACLCGGFIIYKGIEQKENGLVITGLAISSLALFTGIMVGLIAMPSSRATPAPFLERPVPAPRPIFLNDLLEEAVSPHEEAVSPHRELSESPPPY